MKVSKKALSVVMAVLIIVTSLSVGFSALAADPYDTLAAALGADGVRDAVWPGSAQQTGSDNDGHTEFRTVINDPTGDIEAAAEAFWAVASGLAPGHTAKGVRSDYNTLKQIRDEILTKLQNEHGVVGDALSVANKALNTFTAFQEGDADGSGVFSHPSVPQNRDYTFELIRGDVNQLLAYDSVSDVPDTLYGAVEYKWWHDAQNGGSFGKYWRNLVLQNWNRTETRANTSVPAALKAFDAYFTDELLASDLNAMSAEELIALYDNSQAQVDALAALNLWGNDAVMNHFFDKNAIKTFINTVQTARDKKYALEFAQQLAEQMKNDPTKMEYDALAALLDALNTLRASLNGCTADAVAYALAETGLKMEQINAFIDSVEVEKQVFELQGIKATIDALIAATDLATISDEELTKTWADATAQYNMVIARKPAAVSRVFTEGTAYVTDFIHNAKVEIEARKLSTEVEEFLIYFNDDLLNTRLDALTTDALINERLIPAEEKIARLNQYDPDTLDRVFGEEKWDAIEAYVARIHTTLINRVEAQIDEAIENYEDFGKITLLNYKAVKEAIGGVEANILQHITASAELQAKYDRLAPMLDEYNRFVETKGLSGWQKYEPEYPLRGSMPGDIARTQGEKYAVTSEKLDEVIGSLDGLMQNSQFAGLLGLDQVVSVLLKQTIADNLYTDETVNTVMVQIYSVIIDNLKDLDIYADLNITGQVLLDNFKAFGLYVYPTVLDDRVREYVDNGAHPEWQAVEDELDSIKSNNWAEYDLSTSWGVHDQASFVDAFSVALSGLDPILKAVLTGNPLNTGKQNIALGGVDLAKARLEIKAMNLYDKAILPLMETLGCKGMVDAETYNQYTKGKDLLGSILNPLLSWVTDTVAENPVSTVLDILPKLAYIMEFDMITEILKSTPVSISVTLGDLMGWLDWTTINVLDTAGIAGDNLYDLLSGILPMLGVEGLDLSMLSDVNKLISTILGLVAPDANLVLPTIDQALLASHGTLVEAESGRTGGKRLQLVVDKADTLLAVLRYVLPMLGDQDFLDSVFALIGSLTGSEINLGDDVMGILKNLGSNPDQVIAALTELFVPQEYASKQMNYAYQEQADDAIANGEPGAVINNVTYSEDWTKEQAQYISDRLPQYIDNMMLILGGKDTLKLSELIKGYVTGIYTNETVTSLVLMVKDLLAGLGDIDLKPILGLVGIDLSAWDAVEEGYDWGFADGDKDGFAAALTKALTPFTPILATVLADQDLEVLGAVKANGYPGYKTGVIPILESLGCDPADIMAYDEYAAAVKADSSVALSAILTPVLNLLEDIYTDPVNKVFEILPNLLYFINNDGLQVCVENAAQAVFVLLDTIRPVYSLDFSLNLDLTQLVIDALAGLEINGQPVNLKIPFLNDLNMLTVGTVTPYESKSGETAYHLENVDQADFVTVILRNVVELAFYEDNINIVADLIANSVGMSDELKKGLREVLNMFATMYKDDNGVDKILGATYTIFKGTDDAVDGSIGALKDFNERWNAVFQSLYESGNQNLIDLAKLADKLLDMITLGFITGEGVGTNGLIEFFERLVAFFQGKVTDVSIDRTEATVYQGETTKLKVSLKPSTAKNKDVVWASSDEKVATVDGGVVTAVAPGSAMITATTVDGGFEVSCVVHVRANKAQLEELVGRVLNAGLTEEDMTAEQWAALSEALTAAQDAVADTFANQAAVNAAYAALNDAYLVLNHSTKVERVAITQNGAPVQGEVLYVKVPWTKRWNDVPVEVGLQTNEGVEIKSVKWSYANWAAKDQQATIETPDAKTTLIRAIYGVGPRSCWIQATVEDIYGNMSTSAPLKVRFYNFDWQK